MITRFISFFTVIAVALAAPVYAAANALETAQAAVVQAIKADNSAQLKQSLYRLKALDPANPLLAQGLVRLAGNGANEGIYDALSALNAAIAKHPENIPLKRTRALFIIGAPWQRLALADLNDVIAMEDPGSAALQAFVDTSAGNGRTDIGEARITEILDKKPQPDPGLLRARADLRYIKGNFDGALADLSQAIRRSQAKLDDHLLRYRIHTKRGDDAAALADVDAMRTELPQDKGLMRMRASLLIRLGRTAEADQMLLKANQQN